MDCLGYPAAPPCSPHLRRGRHVGAQSQDGEIFQGKIIIKTNLEFPEELGPGNWVVFFFCFYWNLFSILSSSTCNLFVYLVENDNTTKPRPKINYLSFPDRVRFIIRICGKFIMSWWNISSNLDPSFLRV